jgi:16S rRNA processing protein RimM
MIAIGQIVRSNGIRGEVRLNLLTDHPERLQQLTHVWVGPEENRARQLAVERVRLHRHQAVLKLKSIESRDAADSLKEQFVFIHEQQALPLANGSYFIHEIVGMQVTTDEGRNLGTVEEVWQMPANDVWVVRRNGEEILLPAIRDVIRSVDRQQRAIVIHALEGLLD